MRWLPALLVLAACAPGDPAAACEADGVLVPADASMSVFVAPPSRPPPAPAPPTWQPAPAVEMPAPPVEPAPAGAIVAPPSAAIRALAVVEDGSAAVSVDIDGHVRLWPTLDGSREPVVVAMRRPVMLAVARTRTDLVIAGVDGAGQLEIADVGPFGAPRWRKPVELPRPVIEVRAAETGFLVETDDQHLGFVDLGARLEGEVEPPAGTNVAAIAVSHQRMLALLSGGGAVHGRWLTAAGYLRWGEETDALPIAPRAIALSPDATMLAGIVEDGEMPRLAIIGIEHADRRALTEPRASVDPSVRAMYWLDNATVLTASPGDLALWRMDGGSLRETAFNSGPIATDGGETAIVGAGTELMLLAPSGAAHFLGFRLPALTSVVRASHSLLASDGGRVIRLGEDLREYASYDVASIFGPDSTSVIALVDGNHALVASYRDIERFDVVALDTLDAAPVDETEWLGYDPATHLAAFRYLDHVHFRRFESATGAFSSAADLPTEPGSRSTVEFTDGGAFVTTYTDKAYVMRTVTRIRPERETLTVSRTHKQPFTDPAERVLGPAAPPFWRTVKSPDGTLTARLGSNRMSLLDADGTVRWTVPANGANDLVWMRSGALIAIGSGLARVDVDTGDLVERRCGWEFGLWPLPDNTRTRTASTMCDAE